MLANVPVGEKIWSQFPAMGEWLMNVPNLAGQRGMLIGAGMRWHSIRHKGSFGH